MTWDGVERRTQRRDEPIVIDLGTPPYFDQLLDRQWEREHAKQHWAWDIAFYAAVALSVALLSSLVIYGDQIREWIAKTL